MLAPTAEGARRLVSIGDRGRRLAANAILPSPAGVVHSRAKGQVSPS